MDDDELDPSFAALPQHLQTRIDAAFENALTNSGPGPEPARKRRKLDHTPGGFIAAGGFMPEEPAPGGFVVDEPGGGGFVRDEAPAAGGFMAPAAGGFIAPEQDDSDAHAAHTHIPLSLIPAALQLLDLQPDDEDVLSVFSNAASGWGSGARGEAGDDAEEMFVSRKDWRAVCAALLDAGDGEEDDVSMEEEDGAGAEASGEDYVQSESEEEGADGGGDSDDDSYGEGTQAKKGKGKAQAVTKRRTSTRSLQRNEEQVAATDGRLSARQKTECRCAFALFFPDVADEELDRQRLGIKDITRVAKLLKEKITAEEVSMFRPSYDFAG